MSRMGGSCSLQRQRAVWQEQQRQRDQDNNNGSNGSRSDESSDSGRSLRHTVDREVPDGSISALYPLHDNYVTDSANRRSPKSLTDLCVDAVCRSLPDLDGELPPGLPQDIIDSIVKSLQDHAALNATTLRVLRNCELGSLSLAGCRGVTDEWLTPLSNRNLASSVHSQSQPDCFMDSMDVDTDSIDREIACIAEKNTNEEEIPLCTQGDSEDSSSCSTSSFVSASSTPATPSSAKASIKATSITTPLELPFSDEIVPQKISFSPNIIHESLPSITSQLTTLDLRGSQRLTDKGLLQLSGLDALEVAKLDNCHSLTGRGLVVFASSQRLHTLSLANCRRLTDEAILNISHLTSITAIALDGCRCLTDQSLLGVSNLAHLSKLDLSQCDLITDDGIKELHRLEHLEELSLGWCRSITDEGIETLVDQPNRQDRLRILRLARCSITDNGVKLVGKLRALEELDLNGCSSIGSAALGSTLKRLPNLTTLDVSYCSNILRSSWQGKVKSLKSLELCYSGVKDIHLAALTSLPALEELNLDSCPVGDWAIAHLADNNVVPNLTCLDLADTDLTDNGMAHLPKFQKMNRLSLFYCNITNAGLRHLSSMTSLEVLNLDSRDIGDDGLFHLRRLTNLRSLDIFSGRITDEGCAYLSEINSLETLELCGGGVGDLGCAYLATLENLTSLNLSQNERITNRGVASLAALSNLKALNLSNTRVTSGALRFLRGLVKLQSLALYGCRDIDDDARSLDMLQRELPSLKCLRLNKSADSDGIVRAPDDDMEEAVAEAAIQRSQARDDSDSDNSSQESAVEDETSESESIRPDDMDEDHA